MVQPVDANKGKYSSDFQLKLNLQKGLAPIESDTDCQAHLNMAYLLCNCFIGCLAPKEVVHFHPFSTTLPGVLVFEMLSGRPPFQASSREPQRPG